MALMGNHAGCINGQLKSDKPNVQTIQSSAALVETLSKLPFEAFVPGSESVGNTKAKPEVFKDTAKIKELFEKMQAEVAKLSTTAKGGDVKAIRTQFGAVGQARKAMSRRLSRGVTSVAVLHGCSRPVRVWPASSSIS